MSETAPSPQECSDLPPLRGELYSIDHLRSHARQLAADLQVVPHQPSNRRFFQQFRRNARQLRAAHRTIAEAIHDGEPLTPDAEWLLDNFYVVEEQLYEIEHDLPPAFFRELPKLADGNPRVLQIAEELVIHTDSVIVQAVLTAFMNEFQVSAPLTIGELWALPIMLRLDEVAESTGPARNEINLVSRRMTGFESATSRTHLLSNGTYSVMVTNAGGGYSRRSDIGVYRWRPDFVKDVTGQFIYICDRRNRRLWSATYQPTCATPDCYEVTYSIDKAEYRRRDGEIETHLEVAVYPDADVEVRQLTITNHGRWPCDLEITSDCEVSLATAAADLAHPAFQKPFVETE